MGVNSFLPFGQLANVETGDVLSQAQYADEPQRSTGNQLGVARRALVNKVLRQTSTLVSALGGIVAQYGDMDITDSMIVLELTNAMEDAIKALTDVPPATTGNTGQVRLATVAETQQGLSEVLAVTPAGLASMQTSNTIEYNSNGTRYWVTTTQNGRYAVVNWQTVYIPPATASAGNPIVVVPPLPLVMATAVCTNVLFDYDASTNTLAVNTTANPSFVRKVGRSFHVTSSLQQVSPPPATPVTVPIFCTLVGTIDETSYPPVPVIDNAIVVGSEAKIFWSAL